jgi:hypothetical protein
MPDELPMVATPALLLVQLPPPGDEVKVVVPPAHNDNVPLMAAGDELDVIVNKDAQPVAGMM